MAEGYRLRNGLVEWALLVGEWWRRKVDGEGGIAMAEVDEGKRTAFEPSV